MMDSVSSAFISYHHVDSIVDEVLHNVLFALAALSKGRRQLNCFFNAKT
jgi:hypothetical protein